MTGPGPRSAQSNSGVGVQFMFGKEWWVSANWGLGAALQVTGAARMREYDLSGTTFTSWSGGGAALLFTATYN